MLLLSESVRRPPFYKVGRYGLPTGHVTFFSQSSGSDLRRGVCKAAHVPETAKFYWDVRICLKIQISWEQFSRVSCVSGASYGKRILSC
jgi:hypothetical protein